MLVPLGTGMNESAIVCSTCGDPEQGHYVVKKRLGPESKVPAAGGVRLQCVDCLIRAAQKAGVPPDGDAIEEFVDSHVTGSMAACSQMMNFPKMSGGGQHMDHFEYF